MRPNIIVYFVDQQRWDTVGAYGQPLDITPNLDRMAQEGTLFNNAFTCQPVCGPARSCLQTGKFATETGCFVNGHSLPLDEKTLAHYLGDVGYETGYVGKWHLASDKEENHYEATAVPKERQGGYRDWWMASDVLEFTSHGYGGHVFDKEGNKVEFNGYRTDCITDMALDFIKSRSLEKPYFLFLSHIEPHHQNDANRYEGPVGSKEKYKDFVEPEDLKGTKGDWQESYPDYLGCCNRLDENLQRIRTAVKEQGQEDNTIIFYLSDHGSHFKTRNEEYKRSCHEASIRIPFIAYGGPFSGGNETDELVSLIDLPRTILYCAGVEVAKQIRGKSLVSLVENKEEDWRDAVFIQISESQVGRAIRTKRWKYAVDARLDGWKESNSDIYYEDFLYDLDKDPFEKNNLIGQDGYDEIRAELATILKEKMKEAGEEVPKIEENSSK